MILRMEKLKLNIFAFRQNECEKTFDRQYTKTTRNVIERKSEAHSFLLCQQRFLFNLVLVFAVIRVQDSYKPNQIFFFHRLLP